MADSHDSTGSTTNGMEAWDLTGGVGWWDTSGTFTSPSALHVPLVPSGPDPALADSTLEQHLEILKSLHFLGYSLDEILDVAEDLASSNRRMGYEPDVERIPILRDGDSIQISYAYRSGARDRVREARARTATKAISPVTLGAVFSNKE
jgi:hypothetical protein